MRLVQVLSRLSCCLANLYFFAVVRLTGKPRLFTEKLFGKHLLFRLSLKVLHLDHNLYNFNFRIPIWRQFDDYNWDIKLVWALLILGKMFINNLLVLVKTLLEPSSLNLRRKPCLQLKPGSV